MSLAAKLEFLIKKGAYVKEDMNDKLDTFYLLGRISKEDYDRLYKMVNPEANVM